MSRKFLTKLLALTMCAGLVIEPVTAFAQEEPEEIFLEESDDVAVTTWNEDDLPPMQNVQIVGDIISWDPVEGASQYFINNEKIGMQYCLIGTTQANLKKAFKFWVDSCGAEVDEGTYTLQLYAKDRNIGLIVKPYVFEYEYRKTAEPQPDIMLIESVNAISNIADLVDMREYSEPYIEDEVENALFESVWERFDGTEWEDMGPCGKMELPLGTYRIRTTMTLSPNPELALAFAEGITLTVDGQQWNDEGVYTYTDKRISSAVFTSPEYEVTEGEPIEPIDPDEPENITGGTWIEKWGATYYMTADGEFLKGMHTVEGYKYYFNEKGIMQRYVFHQEDDKIYYFDSEGIAVTGWLDRWVSTYYFDEDGVMQTGFVDIDGDTYYFNEHGHQMHNYWVEEDGKTYYIKADGTMAKAENIKRWGKKYSFDENGVLIK